MPESLQGILTTLDSALHYELFQLNNTAITIASLVMFVVVVIFFSILSRFVSRFFLRKLLSRFRIAEETQFMMRRLSHYVIMILGTVIAFQFIGFDLSGLAVIFGLLSVGIGFGLQNLTSNFISGVILLFERPINIGDRITVGDTEGDVLSINMRSTTISSLQNITIIVPNSEFISSQVINWSHGDPRIRLDIDIGVSYSSDLDKVVKALLEVAEDHPAVLENPRCNVLFRNFGDSAWNLTLCAWISNPKGHHQIRSDLNGGIVRKFREFEIEIPFPQRDLHVRSPLPVPLTNDIPGSD
jgi:small-conductance mechanosensitive channel